MHDNPTTQPGPWPPIPPAYGGPTPPPQQQQWQPMGREYLPPHQPSPAMAMMYDNHEFLPPRPVPNPNHYPPQVYHAAAYRGVSKERKQTSHTFHLLMTLFTCGLWALCVWAPLTIWHAMGPRRKNVTRYR